MRRHNICIEKEMRLLHKWKIQTMKKLRLDFKMFAPMQTVSFSMNFWSASVQTQIKYLNILKVVASRRYDVKGFSLFCIYFPYWPYMALLTNLKIKHNIWTSLDISLNPPAPTYWLCEPEQVGEPLCVTTFSITELLLARDGSRHTEDDMRTRLKAPRGGASG